LDDHTDWADAKLLTWHETDYVSYMSFVEDYLYYPLRIDRSIDNNPITLGGAEYAKGLGSHAYSSITVELNGEYNLFASVIGIDDEVMDEDTSDVANTTFVVYLDGEEVYCSGKNDDKYKDIVLLNVSGAELLELVTETNGDPMYDHTDWADARLIKYAEEEIVDGGGAGTVGLYYLRGLFRLLPRLLTAWNESSTLGLKRGEMYDICSR
jgi:hypothetical protein